MPISNTSILIKRSQSVGRPSSLQSGEFAYSYTSNTLFLGSPTGNGVVNVGGQYYTSTLDAATQSNTASTLVKRDSNGGMFGRFYGVANTAVLLDTPKNFSVSGGDMTATAVLFTGNNDVVLNTSLNAVPGLTAGFYGGSTQSSSTIPIVQVAANGRIMAIANTTVTSSFNVSDGTTSNTIYSGSTFYHTGIKGITTATSGNTMTFGTDNTVLRSNTTSVGNQTITSRLTITGDLSISGNVSILGNTTSINTNTLETNDPLILLAVGNYTTDINDIGFVGHYNNGANAHTGFIRNHANKEYYIFDGYTPEISGNNQINFADATFHQSNVNVQTLKGNVIATTVVTTQANTTSDLGVGGNSYVTGNQRIATNLTVIGTTTLTGQANTTNDLGVGGNGYVAGNFKVFGNTTLVNQLTVPNGGTGQQSFNTGQVLIGSGVNGLQQLANVASINSTLAANNTVSNLTTDVWGRVTGFTTQAIAGLTVGQGGTGRTSFNTNGIVYGNSTDGSGPIQSTYVAGFADQTWSNQILTVTNAGVPVWSSAMDGGQF
jgi:hypothetical protein